MEGILWEDELWMVVHKGARPRPGHSLIQPLSWWRWFDALHHLTCHACYTLHPSILCHLAGHQARPSPPTGLRWRVLQSTPNFAGLFCQSKTQTLTHSPHGPLARLPGAPIGVAGHLQLVSRRHFQGPAHMTDAEVGRCRSTL